MIRIEKAGAPCAYYWQDAPWQVPVRIEDTGGRLGVARADLPGKYAETPHCHELEDEGMYVVAGEVGLRSRDGLLRARPGELLWAPRRTPHQLLNLGDEPAQVVGFLTPGYLQQGLREAWREGADSAAGHLRPYGLKLLESVLDFIPEFPPGKPPWLRSCDSLPSVWMAGDIYTILLDGQDTSDLGVVVHARIPPGGGPVPHIHTRDLEAFVILEGLLTLYADGLTVTAQAGDTVVLPAGIPHAFRNTTKEFVTMLMVTAPAGFDRLIRLVSRQAGEGQPGPPDEQELAVLQSYAGHFGVVLRPDIGWLP